MQRTPSFVSTLLEASRAIKIKKSVLISCSTQPPLVTQAPVDAQEPEWLRGADTKRRGEDKDTSSAGVPGKKRPSQPEQTLYS